MISREAALQLTETHYPRGPEELAKGLQVKVASSPLVGVEGWCIQGNVSLFRLNSSSSKVRQRFTLAHELAHLVLGTAPDIAAEPFRSLRADERAADHLASEFLIPDMRLRERLGGKLPVSARALCRLAKEANVSPVMAACRVVYATDRLGLQNAAVVFFIDSREQWRYSHGLTFNSHATRALLQEAVASNSSIVRQEREKGNVVVGSLIDAQAYQVLLIQLLAKDVACQETYEETMKRLAGQLFGKDLGFQQSVAASLGTVKRKCAGLSLDDAIDYFMQHYPGIKYVGAKGSQLQSHLGKEYVRMYLRRWFNEE